MIENPTRHKMEEAYHFLSMMKQAFKDDDISSYNLSAFLSASRSITFYMQKQYAHKDGFPEWYCVRQIKMSADPELKYLNEARVEDVHKEPVMTGATREISITMDAYIVKEGEKIVEPIKKSELISMTQKQSNPRTIRHFFVNFKHMDVIEFCEGQLLKLSKLVEECEKRFT